MSCIEQESQNLVFIESLKLPDLPAPTRLSDLPAGTFQSIPSRKGFKNALKQGWVYLDGSRAYTGTVVKGGELIELFRVPAKKPSIPLSVPVLYEDDYLAVLNKPAGLLVSGNQRWTLENALPYNLKPSTANDGLARPEPIHRLDYPTTGVLLVGKTAKVVSALNRAFEQRMVQKTYLAVTIGTMQESGSIHTPVDHKPAETHFEVLKSIDSEKYGRLNLVKLHPITGRRHQLRKHVAGLGNPILGDKDYGKAGFISKGNGLYLHALELKFTHPILGKTLTVEAPKAKKFTRLFP